MLRKATFLALMFLAAGACAQAQQSYLDGKLLQMNTVRCEVLPRHASTSVSSKKDSASKNAGSNRNDATDGSAQACYEYLLQADEVIYTIRPMDSQHESFLPVGDWTQFRLEKEKLFLRLRSAESREREYAVISIKPRAESSAGSIRLRLNHLQ